MEIFDNSLLVIETASLTAGWLAHEAVASVPDIKILDASPIAESRFLILASGEKAALETAFKTFHAAIETDAIIDQEILKNIGRPLIEASFALGQERLAESLVIVETETVSGLYEVAQLLVSIHALKPIELRIHRTSKGAHGYFTGDAKSCGPAAADAQTRLRSSLRKGAIECIEAPSTQLRALFE